MKVCVMTQNNSQVLIVDEIIFNNSKEFAAADIFVNGMPIGNFDLTKCELKKLDRHDNNMEYYEIIEK